MTPTTQFNQKTFTIRKLKGISEQTILEHIKLYEGYVKHINIILSKIDNLKSNPESAYELSEARRRFGFEFNGMKNHELYFGALEGKKTNISKTSNLFIKIEKQFGSFENWSTDFKTLAKTRGIGWVVLYYDKTSDSLIHSWIDEQHIGHLVGLTPIVAIDMWEHSYVADYQPSGKAQYIEDYFEQINWTFVEQIFDSALQ